MNKVQKFILCLFVFSVIMLLVSPVMLGIALTLYLGYLVYRHGVFDYFFHEKRP